METIFHPYHSSSAERSDRSAGDRLRHRQKVREAIRQNIADIIAEESIIGKDRDRIIKVPIRGIKEYRFVYGENAPGVSQGGDDAKPGQVIARDQGKDHGRQSGDQPGIDFYETDVTLDELVEIMFEDLELSFMERKHLREIEVEHHHRRKGYRKKGIRVHLDKKRTARARLKRKKATQRRDGEMFGSKRFPFHKDDLTYSHRVIETRRESNAVVFCIMDTIKNTWRGAFSFSFTSF